MTQMRIVDSISVKKFILQCIQPQKVNLRHCYRAYSLYHQYL